MKLPEKFYKGLEFQSCRSRILYSNQSAHFICGLLILDTFFLACSSQRGRSWMTSNTGTEHCRPPGHLAVHCAYRTCLESFIISEVYSVKKNTLITNMQGEAKDKEPENFCLAIVIYKHVVITLGLFSKAVSKRESYWLLTVSLLAMPKCKVLYFSGFHGELLWKAYLIEAKFTYTRLT